MSPEADPSLPVSALTTVASAETRLAVPVRAGALSFDDLGPSVCPTCGSWQRDAMDVPRAVGGLVLSLFASSLGLIGSCATLLGLLALTREGPAMLLLGLVTAAGGGLAAYVAHRVARRTTQHQTTCSVCGETAGRWASASSTSVGLLATVFSGLLFLPGLGLVAIAIATFGGATWRPSLACGLIGLFLLMLAVMIMRRPWTSARGTDWASSHTLGRLFLSGQGVGTSPTLRALALGEPPAEGLLTAEESLVADDFARLVSRRILLLESRDEIAWWRVLSYHRLTIAPSALHATWLPGAALAPDETAFVERIVGELRAAPLQGAGALAGDYRSARPLEGHAEISASARLPLLELLARIGLNDASARAVEGALRASVQPRRLGSRGYALLRAAPDDLPARR